MKKTIKLKKYLDIIEEYVAADYIQPGFLLAVDENKRVIPHDNPGGFALTMFALEDELRGQGIDGSFAPNDPVQCWVAQRGEQVYARLADGEDVATGDVLVSAGDGTLKAWAEESAELEWPIAIALESIDLSGSALPTGDFIKVVIV